MAKGFVAVIMDSASQVPRGRAVAAFLGEHFGVEARLRVASAAKTPRELLGVLEGFDTDPAPKVYVVLASDAGALAGVTDAEVNAPVIFSPDFEGSFGESRVLAALARSDGLAPLVVLTPEAAALAAAKMLALADPEVRSHLKVYRLADRSQTLRADRELMEGEEEKG